VIYRGEKMLDDQINIYIFKHFTEKKHELPEYKHFVTFCDRFVD